MASAVRDGQCPTMTTLEPMTSPPSYNDTIMMEEEEDDHDEEEECVAADSEEEEQLLPPPPSWFEHYGPPQHDDPDDDNTDKQDPLPKHQHVPSVKRSTTMDLATTVVGSPQKAPSWKELSSQVLPAAARELLSSTMRRIYHTARISYSKGRWRHFQYSDLGNNAGGYFRSSVGAQLVNVDLYGNNNNEDDDDELDILLPPFSSLPWVDRQLVKEWRTCDHTFAVAGEEKTTELEHDEEGENHGDDDDFDRARTLCPQPVQRPKWSKSDVCHACHKPFGPTLLRHHCRLCGKSYCHPHSSWGHRLPHLGYDANVPERVCDGCKRILVEQNLAERVAWRLARCRDYCASDLTPYFETGVDTVEDAALRITKAAITMARSIPLGAQAHVAVETVEVLRKHGLKGIYGLILRKEFLAAADLLCRALGINKTAWPLSVHELSAAIFYALAQHRAMRGMNPEREHLIHTFRTDKDVTTTASTSTAAAADPDQPATDDGQDKKSTITTSEEGTEWGPFVSAWTGNHQQQTTTEQGGKGLPNIQEDDETTNDASITLVDETDTYDPMAESVADLIAMADTASQSQEKKEATNGNHETIKAEDATVKEPSNMDDSVPPELPFTPVCDPVSDQVISSLVLYAPIALNFVYTEREVDMQLLAAQQGWRLLYAHLEQDIIDRPASALFVHREQRIACFAIRGTATINDVVTDIRQMPVPFPETMDGTDGHRPFEDDWTPVFRGQGLAVCGMARAAMNLYREHIDALLVLAEKGYRIRITGHSLGGGVATLLGALVLRHIENAPNLADSIGHAVGNGVSFDGKIPSSSVVGEHSDLLRVYGYGTPSCVDAKLSDYLKTFVTTVVLHDDVVPRLTPTSIRGLLKHLLHIRETWVKAHLTEDLMAITERARTVWAPRWRQSFTLSDSSSTSFKRYVRKQIRIGKRKLLTVKGQLVRNGSQGCIDEEDLICEEDISEHDETMLEFSSVIIWRGSEGKPPDKLSQAPVSDDTHEEKSRNDGAEDTNDVSFETEPEARLIMDYMGGIDYRSQGIVIDGEEFFDAEDSLLEPEDDTVFDSENFTQHSRSPLPSRDIGGEIESNGEVESNDEIESNRELESTGEDESKKDIDSIGEVESDDNVLSPPVPAHDSEAEDDSWAHFDASFDEHPGDKLPDSKSAPAGAAPFGSEVLVSEGLDESDEACAVMLEEAPLPRMFLPGKIVHIYTHRGAYKTAYVPRSFRELRRISLAGNMLTDHTSKAYYEALLEVQSVRKASEGLPRWTGFDEDDTCSCCVSRFTWASTSDSEAQEARDKHNCRSCGTLVCDPCSKNNIPLPSIGIIVPARVCDRCFNDQGGVLTGHSGHALTSSFIAEDTTVVEARDTECNQDLGVLNNADASSLSLDSEAPLDDARKDPPERERDRRSLVVDELASRIHHSSLLSSA